MGCQPQDCGGQSSVENCYCDDQCTNYGDCCDNVEQVCGGGGTTAGATTGGGNAGEVPDIAYCDDVSGWSSAWSDLEEQILTITNQMRAMGADCGTEGTFPPAGPLTMNAALRCSSRVHSMDMADNNFFDHTNLQGESPFDRMSKAGYNYSWAGENIAAGNSTAAATMDQWMNSDGHCANIMNANFTELGVGYYQGGSYGHYWTQNFGSQ